MNKPSHNVEVEFEEKKYSASYSVAKKMVVVDSFWGSRSTHIGGSPAAFRAQMLLLEILRDAKTRGDL